MCSYSWHTSLTTQIVLPGLSLLTSVYLFRRSSQGFPFQPNCWKSLALVQWKEVFFLIYIFVSFCDGTIERQWPRNKKLSSLAFNAHWKAFWWVLVLTLEFTAGWTKHLTFTEVVSVVKGPQKSKKWKNDQFRGRKVEEYDFSWKEHTGLQHPTHHVTVPFTLNSCLCFWVSHWRHRGRPTQLL